MLNGTEWYLVVSDVGPPRDLRYAFLFRFYAWEDGRNVEQICDRFEIVFWSIVVLSGTRCNLVVFSCST